MVIPVGLFVLYSALVFFLGHASNVITRDGHKNSADGRASTLRGKE